MKTYCELFADTLYVNITGITGSEECLTLNVVNFPITRDADLDCYWNGRVGNVYVNLSCDVCFAEDQLWRLNVYNWIAEDSFYMERSLDSGIIGVYAECHHIAGGHCDGTAAGEVSGNPL